VSNYYDAVEDEAATFEIARFMGQDIHFHETSQFNVHILVQKAVKICKVDDLQISYNRVLFGMTFSSFDRSPIASFRT